MTVEVDGSNEATAAAELRLEEAFRGLADGSLAPSAQAVKAAEASGHYSTSQFVYGEVGLEVGPVLRKLDLQPSDVLYDLGSGRGRLVLGAALWPGGPGSCARVVGVELDNNRHAVALQAAARMGETPRPWDLKCGDVLCEPLEDATVAFCNNAVFNERLNGALAGRLSAALTPNLRTAFTTSPLPLKQAMAADLSLSAISVLPVNWSSAGQPLYCYSRGPLRGEVDVDPKTGQMLDDMRAKCLTEECTGCSRDSCLMRVAAFAQLIRGQAKEWSAAAAAAEAREG
mmetsp:Transcript_43893/g.95886  ORF Transcript_43893/g.95886 Transcript_43893/m.95886 type:complete len:286 (+) Transcript_43893:40-897(+)